VLTATIDPVSGAVTWTAAPAANMTAESMIRAECACVNVPQTETEAIVQMFKALIANGKAKPKKPRRHRERSNCRCVI
jgi:hypothetical protein